jgi:hypothetical protein
LISLEQERDNKANRVLARDAAPLRATTAVYQIRIRHNRGPAVLVGTMRLGFDGHAKLTRVAVQKLKPSFPEVQTAVREWLLAFVGQPFTYVSLHTKEPRSHRRVT